MKYETCTITRGSALILNLLTGTHDVLYLHLYSCTLYNCMGGGHILLLYLFMMHYN